MDVLMNSRKGECLQLVLRMKCLIIVSHSHRESYISTTSGSDFYKSRNTFKTKGTTRIARRGCTPLDDELCCWVVVVDCCRITTSGTGIDVCYAAFGVTTFPSLP